MRYISKFLDWYERHLTKSLIVSAIILYIQIPHSVTAADCFFNLGMGVIHFNPILDFFLYSIDLLEAIPIIGITLAIIAKIRKKV
jgi:hypothetical protein